MKGGAPPELVFGQRDRPLSPTQRKAAVVTVGELLGGEFLWNENTWKAKE